MSDSNLAFHSSLHPQQTPSNSLRIDLLHPIRQWLDAVPITNPALARLLYKLIPGQCPFERDIVVLGRKLAHIPPLCKLNPLYDQLVGLRFRSMCYLVGCLWRDDLRRSKGRGEEKGERAVAKADG